MSKSSATSGPKIPTQSAWSKGPPQSSSSTTTPRSQSPAPNNATPPASATHSRRASTLGQGVAFKDGARSPVTTSKPGSVTFGSIDDVSAPISSSPASVPPIKTEGVKSFGSVPATPTTASAVNGKPSTSSTAAAVSTSKPSTSSSAFSTTSASSTAPSTSETSSTGLSKPKFDVKGLFRGTNTDSGPAPSSSPSHPSSDVSSPASRPAPLPHSPSLSQPTHSQSGPHHQPLQPYGNFTPFVPSGSLRPQPNGVNGGGSRPPHSPGYPRQMPNGAPNGVNGRPAGGPPGQPPTPSPMSAGVPSPRLGPPPTHPVPPAGLPPGQQMPVWGPHGYYYPYPTEYLPYSPTPPWPMQPLPSQGQPPGAHPPHIPVSPRNPPPPLHAPGTPTLTPAVANPAHSHAAPSPHMHTSSLSAVTSPPPSTPSSNTGASAARMDRSPIDGPTVQYGTRRVTIKNPLGQEIEIKRTPSSHPPPSPVVTNSPARRVVRLETPQAHQKRVEEEERAKRQEEEKARKEVEERERRKREEEQRKRREEEEKVRAQREAEVKERLRKEEEERQRREAEQKRLREEDEQKRREEEEKVRIRKEEEERQRKEEEEKERLRKEEEERLQREAEEAERVKREEKAKAEAEAEAEAAAAAAAALTVPTEADEKPEPEPESEPTAEPTTTEEGEVEETEEQKSEVKDKSGDKAPLRIDTTVLNGEGGGKRRPGPLNLSAAKPTVAGASFLSSARRIDDFSVINYPEGISSPISETAPTHKLRHYSREFLLQFVPLCMEKPDNIPLDILRSPDQVYNNNIARGGSNKRQPSMSGPMGPPPGPNRAQGPGSGLGITGLGKPGSGFPMGQFGTAPSKLTSDERYAMSNRSSSMSGGPGGMPFGRPAGAPMARSSSQGGPGSTSMGHRTRSKRGEKRNESRSNAGGPPGQPSAFAAANIPALEPVAPLEMSANRWQASTSKKNATVDPDSPEVVERKVKSLLNKLTMERFDSISDQIIAWANKSENEKDGRTLIQVIKLVFEKATDEATWSEMYARLCRKMMEQISSKVQDDGIRSNEGKPIAGGQLFRKYLLNRCQEDFERGWAAKDAAAAAAATKASEDEAAAKAAAENKDGGESALYSEEYYVAQKAKRQGLGLVKFIGELFKLQMLTERIMHECVKKLLHNVENPEEEEIESLCKLMVTVGQLLDVPKARAHMDVYFQRMKELTKGQNVTSRMQFMLQDVIELRERKWIPRNQIAAPTTIAAVHEAAAKEKAAAEKEFNRTISMSRGGSRRGAERGGEQVGPDGWSQVSGPPRTVPKVGDLSQFGKIQKTTVMSFGPSDAFKKGTKSRETTISRTNSSNAFFILSQNSEQAVELPAATTKPSRPASRKPSVDLGAGGIPEPPAQRRKLNLLPRSVKPEESKESLAPSSANSEDETADAGPSISEEEIKQKIEEDSKEFFSVRDLDEAEVYFTKLPTEYRHRLVDKLVTVAIESKDADCELVAGLFSRAVSNNLCSPAVFEEGFRAIGEILDDIVYDSPKAFSLYATMMKGAGLDKDDDRRTRLASKLEDPGKLLSLLP